MKEKYVYAGITIVMLGLMYGAYLEKQDWDEYKNKNRCVEIAKEESYTVYNSRGSGSFTRFPAKITYQCLDGKLITK